MASMVVVPFTRWALTYLGLQIVGGAAHLPDDVRGAGYRNSDSPSLSLYL
jgi:hypothetical protein